MELEEAKATFEAGLMNDFVFVKYPTGLYATKRNDVSCTFRFDETTKSWSRWKLNP